MRGVKWLIAGCVVALSIAPLGTSLASTPAPSPSPSKRPAKLSKWQQHELDMFENSAPADEYFGRWKMSYLGIDNTFRDAAISSGDHTTDPGIAHKVALAEDALDAWARKYPRDPQLARSYFLASLAERKIWLQANQQRAWNYLSQIEGRFGDTYFGKLVRKNLEIGFTEHYYALAAPCATPPAAGDHDRRCIRRPFHPITRNVADLLVHISTGAIAWPNRNDTRNRSQNPDFAAGVCPIGDVHSRQDELR